MKTLTTSKPSKLIATVLIVSCFLIFNTDSFSQESDKWHDQSDELDFGSDNTWLYVSLGVLAAGAITYFIITSSSSDDDSSSSDKDSSEEEKKESGGYFGLESDSKGDVILDSASVKKLIDAR